MNWVDADFDDWRMLCLFEKRPTERAEVMGGVATATGSLIMAPIIIALASLAAGALRSKPVVNTAEIEVVETRFVKLGRPLDPKRLPDRDIPEAQPQAAVPTTTAQPEAATSAAPSPAKVSSAEKPQPSADELLNQLTDRAGAIAETSQSGTEREGHEEGIAEGTEIEDLQNLYLGKLYSYFRRGWQVPTLISDAELQKLSCVVQVTISQDLRVQSFTIEKPSGNDAFDESVNTRMAQTLDAALPPPPDNVANRFIGQTISLRFFGRHAR